MIPLRFNKGYFYIAESARGQDEANPAFWFATQAGKMGSGFPALVPQEKVLFLAI